MNNDTSDVGNTLIDILKSGTDKQIISMLMDSMFTSLDAVCVNIDKNQVEYYNEIKALREEFRTYFTALGEYVQNIYVQIGELKSMYVSNPNIKVNENVNLVKPLTNMQPPPPPPPVQVNSPVKENKPASPVSLRGAIMDELKNLFEKKRIKDAQEGNE